MTPRISTSCSRLGITLASTIILASCASTNNRTSLSSLRAQQEATPLQNLGSLRLPGVLDEALFVPVQQDDPHAWLGLQAALVMLDKPVIPRPTTTRDTTPTEQERLRAMRLYASGKLYQAQGDTEQAIKNLLECVQLDPDFAEPWRELALAHRASGDRLAATAAFRNVLAREPDDPMGLTFVGIDALNRRDYSVAASFLARVWKMRDSLESSAHRNVVAINLGNALQQLGFLSAALDAYFYTHISPRQAPPEYLESEFATIVNAQAERWRNIGDIALRLNRPQDATDAYQRAAAMPSFNPDALLARRIAASVMQGRSAIAASLLLDTLQARRGQTTDTQLALTRYLSSDTTLAAAMRRSLDELEATLSPDELQNASTDLLLTRTALLNRSKALEKLKEHLVAFPYDERISAAFFDVLSSGSAQNARRQTLALIASTPFRYRTYTEYFLHSFPDIEAHLKSLLPLSSYTLERTLLVTHLLLKRSDDTQAQTILDEAIHRLGPVPALLTTSTQIALRRQDAQAARAALQQIQGDSREAILGRAWINRAMGNYDVAFAQIKPLIEPGATPPPSANELLMAAKLCVSREDFEQADALLTRLLQQHPRFEPAHAERISLYAKLGEPYRERSQQAIIELRRVAPSSKTIRWLRAQELIRTGQYNTAEQELLSLATEQLTEPVANLLVTLWIRTGSPQRAQRWLLEQQQHSPADPVFVKQLARVYTFMTRYDEAASILEEWLTNRPGEISLSRQLEDLYRAKLNNPARADALAKARLKRAPASPQRSLELAGLHLNNKEYAQAVTTLNELLTTQPTLNPAQSNLLQREALAIANASLQSLYKSPMQASHLVAAVLQHTRDAPEPLLVAHISLLLVNEADTSTLLEALAMVHEFYPQSAAKFYESAVDLLFKQNRMQDVLDVAKQALQRIDAHSELFISQVVDASSTLLDLDTVLLVIPTAHRLKYTKDFVDINRRDPKISLDDQATAEFAFRFASLFSVNGEIAASHTLYRLTLQYNPSHVMANNNLGYSLADQETSLDEAHRLILKAYTLDPTQGSITDSLGWIRYKLGIFQDVLDDQGTVERQGALTLLTRASTMEDSREDPVVHDHLGDTLWILGQHEQAATHWTSAASFIDTLPEIDPAQATRSLLKVREESQALRQNIRRKLDAVQKKTPPPVADYTRSHNERTPGT